MDSLGHGYVNQPILPPQPLPWWRRWQVKWQAALVRLRQSLHEFDQQPKLVRIRAVEINLTAIWDTISAPLRWVGLLSRRASSRRSKDQLRTVKLIRLIALLGLIGVVGGIISFFTLFAWYSRNLPKPGQVVRREGFSTTILDRNGQTLYDLYDEERRVPVELNQIPDALKQATVAVEDKDFYKHAGIDVLTPFRIAYNVVFRRRVVGGSTLTQQLVKNVLLTNERTLSRKFKEFVLALQIERTFTKDEILAMYLNEAPYGGTAWGVGAATETYFNKSVSELTLVESAILAGLPQRPSAYSPFLGKTDEDGELLWKIRARGVLRRMHEDEYLTDLAYEEALAQLEEVTFERKASDIKAPHFVFYIQDQLTQMYGDTVLEQGGLRVTTTLDYELQQAAEAAAAEEIEKVRDLNITNAAVTALDPQTGEILSMVGSVDYFSQDIDGQFNVAVDGLRQPGSAIKPITYLMMFRNGYSPASMLVDAETTFAANDAVEPYQPKNYDGKFHGPVSLRDSLGSSLNIPAVKSLALVGVEPFLQQAYDMGLATLEPTAENQQRFGLAVTLGGAEVHQLDLVSAYSAFANGGYQVEPVGILKVENKDGQVLYEHKPARGHQVMTAAEAFLINHVLSDNTARLLAFGANSLLNTGKPIAVKTGTTNFQRDNWTIGWSQNMIVGVWVGNNDNTAMKQVASGITGASPIWRRTILKALELGYQAPDWEKPDGVEEVEVDAVSGYPTHDGFPAVTDYRLIGTTPTVADPIHTKLKLCRGENKLANAGRIGTGDYDEKEFVVLKENDPVSQDGRNRWQEGIDAWIATQEGELYKPPTEYCGESADISVKLDQPKDQTNYSGESIEVTIDAASGEGIEKIELLVNGSVRETITNHSYRGTINLAKGRYELKAKAYSRAGQTKESNRARIGTGGTDWEKDPEPTPEPSSSASPSPSPSPSASPDPSPSPSP